MKLTPDAYRCDKCGAEYDQEEFYECCCRDDDGNIEFHCFCGCTDYTEMIQCRLCHGLYDIYKHPHLRWWHVCNDCCGAVVNEYNAALDSIHADYRELLEQIYDIRKIEEV